MNGSRTVGNWSNDARHKTNHRRLVRTRGWAWLVSGALIVSLGNETNEVRDRGEPIWAPLTVATATAVAMVLTGCALLVDSAGSTRRTVFRFHRLDVHVDHITPAHECPGRDLNPYSTSSGRGV
jgi:hypothetical protein